MQAPVRFDDVLLVLVVVASMTTAIAFPDFASHFRALPFYCLIVNFFLSYLAIDLVAVGRVLKQHGGRLFAFAVMKMAILPAAVYFAFRLIAPDYALSALLLTGVSVGVVAPLVSNMVEGDSALVLVAVVVTSVLAPLTIPALVKVVVGKQVAISFLPMLGQLATVIFVPIIVVEFIRYTLPRLVDPVQRIQFPLSLLMFSFINLGVFYRYSHFFRKDPSVIIAALLVVFVLAAVYCVVGILFFHKRPIREQLAGAVMVANMNNVLVIVFSSRFFGAVEPFVAAMYSIPFFIVVIPLRYYYHRRTRAVRLP
jgi:bile acid:Na+ symporter, BASS family